jgi:hypothetical protein
MGKNSLDLRPTWVTTSPWERIEFVSQGSTVFVSPSRLQGAWWSLLSLFPARPQLEQSQWALNSNPYGSPSAACDITYCATWWKLNGNWATYGRREQGTARENGTNKPAIQRPMGESHRETRIAVTKSLTASFVASLYSRNETWWHTVTHRRGSVGETGEWNG